MRFQQNQEKAEALRESLKQRSTGKKDEKLGIELSIFLVEKFLCLKIKFTKNGILPTETNPFLICQFSVILSCSTLKLTTHLPEKQDKNFCSNSF